MSHMSIPMDLVMGYRITIEKFNNRKDKWIGVACSIFFHAVLLIVGGVLFIKPAQVGVSREASGIDVILVADVQEPKPVEQVAPIVPTVPVEKAEIQEFVKPEPIKQEIINEEPVHKIVEKPVVKPNSNVNLTSSSQGALTQLPSYLKNPAPPYPYEARRNGWQGTTIVSVAVNKSGVPTKVSIEKSSGYSVLDNAAIKAVEKWRFAPAKLGEIPVESSLRFPVRFDLEKSKNKR